MTLSFCTDVNHNHHIIFFRNVDKFMNIAPVVYLHKRYQTALSPIRLQHKFGTLNKCPKISEKTVKNDVVIFTSQ